MDGTERELSIDGTVLNVIFRNEENGYTVLRLKTDDGPITAVGCMPGVTAGEGLSLTGSWSVHPSYGEQLQVSGFTRRKPSGRRAILEYLSCGAVKGVGPALAEAIVYAFGEEALDVIENDPDRLSEVRGISPKRAREIHSEFRRRAAVRLLTEFLTEHGMAPVYALKLYKCYGGDALDALKDNPYILSNEYFGADFVEVDRFAQSLGLEDDSPKRIEAAVIFVLRDSLDAGHSFAPYRKLVEMTHELLGVGTEAVEEAIDMLLEVGDLARERIANQDAVYLMSLYEAERYLTARILAMASQTFDTYGRTEELISDIERRQGITYAEMQRRAVELAASSGIMVITGGPGTGKTTSLMGIIALFDRMGLETALAAPTGRAAKRMSELTGREAMTIHRLLGAGYIPGSEELSFQFGEDEPLEVDAVIVDETSMVDIMLMRSLFAAMKPGCRLVLVGDVDQLPPVGPGNFFSDVIRSEAVPIVRLTEIFRQANESAIVRSAHAINRGEPPVTRKGDRDYFFLSRPVKEDTAQTIVGLVAERLPRNMGIESSQIQVLSPSRRGICGTWNLNRLIQAAVNPPSDEKREKAVGNFILREGDRVMQIRNNYDIMWKSVDGSARGEGIFNGDIGTLTVIDTQREVAIVDFDGKLAAYSFDMLFELEPAFAMTVHKSQGSEYRAVVLALSREVRMLMTRCVLYTAVTRAKELLILVGDGGVVMEMTQNDTRTRRYSGLKTRLCRGMQ